MSASRPRTCLLDSLPIVSTTASELSLLPAYSSFTGALNFAISVGVFGFVADAIDWQSVVSLNFYVFVFVGENVA